MVSASGTTVPSNRHGLRWLKRGLSYLLLACLRILDLAWNVRLEAEPPVLSPTPAASGRQILS